MYENYLIDPDAITEALKSFDSESYDTVTVKKVEAQLQSLICDKSLYCDRERSRADLQSEWRAFIHGADVLHKIFADFTEKRLSYRDRKREYGFYLTEWILQNKPELLNKLAGQLTKILQAQHI